jgi:hypothetical protein
MSSSVSILPYADRLMQAEVAVWRNPWIVQIEVPVSRRLGFLSLSNVRERVLLEVRAAEARITHIASSGTAVRTLSRESAAAAYYQPDRGRLCFPRAGSAALELFVNHDPVVNQCVVRSLQNALREPLDVPEMPLAPIAPMRAQQVRPPMPMVIGAISMSVIAGYSLLTHRLPSIGCSIYLLVVLSAIAWIARQGRQEA